MTKAVFDTRASSGYDDDIAHRYHFPDRHLPDALKAVGDWVVYREPRRNGGREGYVSVAKLASIAPDEARPRHSYANMTDYLPFDAVVPLRRASGFYELRLQQVTSPSRMGVALQGKSVRTISYGEFGAIVRDGLRDTLDPANAIRLGLDPRHADPSTLVLTQADPSMQERLVGQFLVNRPIRDAVFRRSVLDAYDNRCAVTGLRILNGGGKAEAQAAHIVPVADGGPDVVQNGLALSGTVHWLFDRHLISLTDDFGLLVSHNKVPPELRGLFARQLDRVHLPANPALIPTRPSCSGIGNGSRQDRSGLVNLFQQSTASDYLERSFLISSNASSSAAATRSNSTLTTTSCLPANARKPTSIASE